MFLDLYKEYKKVKFVDNQLNKSEDKDFKSEVNQKQ